MDLPNWVYIVGIVLVNVILLVIVCMIVFKRKEVDEEIEKEIFNNSSSNVENENLKAMDEIYSAMAKATKRVSKVESFEQEQEENAIISFQELLKFKAEQEKMMAKEESIEKEEATIVETKQEETKKFSNTEVISPVFGRMEKEEKEENHELEKSLNINPLKKEIKESEDFLNALKDFRKNL